MKIIFDHSKGHIKDDRVFCEAFVIPEGEKECELLELGFLPNIQPPLYWYQARSCRINNDKVNLSYKRKKILSQLEIQIFSYKDIKEDVDSFFINYIQLKKLDMFSLYTNNSTFDDLKVMEVKYQDKVVAYTRFREFEKSLLGLETALTQDIPKFSLGKDAILLLSGYGKSQGKNLLYIYESYEDFFPYKMEITGAEYWEGEKWI
jgi:hypothetical protein